jgi:hypothetical protein
MPRLSRGEIERSRNRKSQKQRRQGNFSVRKDCLHVTTPRNISAATVVVAKAHPENTKRFPMAAGATDALSPRHRACQSQSFQHPAGRDYPDSAYEEQVSEESFSPGPVVEALPTPDGCWSTTTIPDRSTVIKHCMLGILPVFFWSLACFLCRLWAVCLACVLEVEIDWIQQLVWIRVCRRILSNFAFSLHSIF